MNNKHLNLPPLQEHNKQQDKVDYLFLASTLSNTFDISKLYNLIIFNYRMSTNQLKLPPINAKTENNIALPNDNDLLLENQLAVHSDQKGLKIWEKKTASCRSKLKRFDNFQTAIDDKYVPINAFNQKEKKGIQSALQIIQMRKKNKDLVGKNETIVQILQQKKQMFLVTMTHGIIEEQIKNLTKQALDRQGALRDSNKVLQKDKEDFEQYYDKYKGETKKIEEQYEKQVQKRLAKEQEIKARQITVNSLRTLKVRNEESIASALRYKNFLNQLPPTDWVQQQSSKRRKRLNQIKQRLKNDWTLSASSVSKKSTNSAEDFQKYFEKIVESGENEQIEEVIYDEEMYFKQASQLIQFFNNLQESNLFNIQNSHIAQQKYQQLKVKSQQKKAELSAALQSHKQRKRQLEKQFSDFQNQIKQLRKKKDQNSLLDEKDNKDIKATITQEYDGLKQFMGSSKENPNNSYLPDLESKNSQSLSLLSAIEICMERLWQKLRQYYNESPSLIKQIRNNHEKKKNNEKREEAAKFNKLEQQKRKNRNNEKKEPILKITGRIDMKRSPPQQKIMQKKVEVTDKDIDDDRKYLVQ